MFIRTIPEIIYVGYIELETTSCLLEIDIQ